MKRTALISAFIAMAASGCVSMLGGNGDGYVLRAKEKVAPALVHVRPVKEVFRGGKREEIPVLGSGFIITRDGYVVTNEHVAGGSKLVRCVLFNKEEVDAEVVGTDKYTDIAVLKLKTDHTDLPTVKFDLSGKLKPGQTVLALGSPHGLARSVSKGIVSVTDRYLGGAGEMVSPYNNWIQTDAAINPGNSGGPLVNLKGEVVGINARRLGGADNIGFAIPIGIAKEAIDQIIAHGHVRRSWIGVTLQEMMRKTNDPSQKGVVIGDVDPLSPANEAGVRPGDVLLSVDDWATNARFVEDLPPVLKHIADIPVGEKAVLRIMRGEEEIEIVVITDEKSNLKGKEVEMSDWGFTVSDLTPAIVRRARLASREGVYVSGIQVGGIIANADLSRGDIILKLDDVAVDNLATFQRLYDERIDSKQDLVLLDIKRGAVKMYMIVKQRPEGEAETDESDQDGDR